MARKNEFRMDPEHSGILGWLLLTKLQRQVLLRWCLYALVCLVGLLAQDVLLYRFSVLGAVSDLVPCLILMIAVLQSADTGSVFALTASILYYFSGSAPGPYVIPMITCIAVFLVIFRQGYLQQGFWAVLICTTAGMLLYEMGLFGIGLFLGRTLSARAGVMAMTALITLAWVPVVYPVLRAIGKIGGDIWKE